MPLERSSSAHSHADLAAPLAVLAVPVADIIDLSYSQARAVTEFDFTAGSPPDIPLTNSALLI
jgi:hypothetical protein